MEKSRPIPEPELKLGGRGGGRLYFISWLDALFVEPLTCMLIFSGISPFCRAEVVFSLLLISSFEVAQDFGSLLGRSPTITGFIYKYVSCVVSSHCKFRSWFSVCWFKSDVQKSAPMAEMTSSFSFVVAVVMAWGNLKAMGEMSLLTQ